MKKLMTHIVAGYPSFEKCEAVALTMIESGIEYLEIQIPFSDPVADGPTIMKACHQVLGQGFELDQAFRLMQRLREKTDIPLYFMTYANIPFKYGLEDFLKRSKEAGASGFIIPDLPYDQKEGQDYLELCEALDMDPILVVSPITSDQRLVEIGKRSRPLVYAISSSGITGSKREITTEMKAYLEKVKQLTQKPVALGFGLQTREQIEQACEIVDVAIVGSQIVRLSSEEGGMESIKELLA